MNNSKTILIGMPSGSGMVPTIMLQSLLMLHKPYPCAFLSVERQRVDKARNHMTMEALRGGFDYLFFVDDDNPIPIDTLEKFIEDDKDIVSAPILGRNPDKNGIHPLCCFYAREIIADKKPLKLYFPVTQFKENHYLHKVDATGTGCLLIKRKVLEKLNTIYQDSIFEFGDIKFNEKVTVDGKEYDRRTMSEDCEFSERAVKAGFEIWVDERIKPIHLTTLGSIRWNNG